MIMYLCREPEGMYRLCENVPVKMNCYWKPENHRYFNINSKFGETIFPLLDWNDNIIEIDIIFGEGDKYYVTQDLSGTVRIHKSEPRFYSIFNKKVNHLTEYWDSKEQFTCEKQFGDELFDLQDHRNCQEILLKISLK